MYMFHIVSVQLNVRSDVTELQRYAQMVIWFYAWCLSALMMDQYELLSIFELSCTGFQPLPINKKTCQIEFVLFV